MRHYILGNSIPIQLLKTERKIAGLKLPATVKQNVATLSTDTSTLFCRGAQNMPQYVLYLYTTKLAVCVDTVLSRQLLFITLVHH
jgi:hypothetical protein